MVRYRLIDTLSNKIVEDNLSASEAQIVLMMRTDPSSPSYKSHVEIEKYSVVSDEGKRYGRDPDLH